MGNHYAEQLPNTFFIYSEWKPSKYMSKRLSFLGAHLVEKRLQEFLRQALKYSKKSRSQINWEIELIKYLVSVSVGSVRSGFLEVLREAKQINRSFKEYMHCSDPDYRKLQMQSEDRQVEWDKFLEDYAIGSAWIIDENGTRYLWESEYSIIERSEINKDFKLRFLQKIERFKKRKERVRREMLRFGFSEYLNIHS